MATIEWTHGIIRGGTEHTEYGDDYQWSGVVILDGTTATIKGLSGILPPISEFISQLHGQLVPVGARYIEFTRFKNGIVQHYRFDLLNKKIVKEK